MDNQLLLKANIFLTLMMAFFVVIVSAYLLRSLEITLLTVSAVPLEVGREERPGASPAPAIYDYLAQVGHSLLGLETAYAKTVEPDYAAEKYSKIKEMEMAPGERKEIKIGFYNRGRYNWRRSSKNFISIYTDKPHYRQSVFQDKSWYRKDQPAKLKDSLIGPGKLGYFEFYLQAPQKPGVYEENFALAAENKAWLAGGKFQLVITVDSGAARAAENEKKDSPSPAAKLTVLNPRDYRARRLTRLEPLVLSPAQESDVQVMFLNQGKKSWAKREIVLEKTRLSLSDTPTAATVFSFSGAEVKTGQTEIFAIPWRAPEEPGIYQLYFNLLINGQLIQGGRFVLQVAVGAGEGELEKLRQAAEPIIRVGLYTTEEPVIFASPFAYRIKTVTGEELGQVRADEVLTISFNLEDGLYTLQWSGAAVSTTSSVRLEPLAAGSYFTLTNYNNRLSRDNKKINYNQFRDVLEMRLADGRDYLWVINELAMESYLKGLAETAESAPAEFQKALMVAARTYAFYHLFSYPGKHPKSGITLDADIDQVYRGYVLEKNSPRQAAAVEATRGLIVTYDGEAVETPYFARSDGRTRTWKEAWGGGGEDKPWLKSVKTPYDRGYSRLGHGVGMSAHDAIARAKKGALYEEILKYYYQGIEVQKVY